jgi:hypothetical protein
MLANHAVLGLVGGRGAIPLWCIIALELIKSAHEANQYVVRLASRLYTAFGLSFVSFFTAFIPVAVWRCVVMHCFEVAQVVVVTCFNVVYRIRALLPAKIANTFVTL